ncbi:hypothetical protein CP557_15985 [Natrinema ejinorense]|uniref:Uncharacterized protein n=1 Tax=Natrinema ejinorense TaxID=373386 RepID=A0A2A5QYI4_9EURY|nr:hypothetical protein CP557_15985 [Natrinema ejinorense]
MLKKTGVAVTGTVLAGSAVSGTATAGSWDSLPYDTVEGSQQDKYTIQWEKDKPFSSAKLAGTTTVDILDDGTQDDGGYTYKFGVATHGLGLDEDEGDKQKAISSHAVKVWEHPSSTVDQQTVYTTNDSDVTGAWAHGNGTEIPDPAVDTIHTAVSLANTKYAVATGAATITDNILDYFTKGCNERDDCVLFEWAPSSLGVDEVTHTTKFRVDVPESEVGCALLLTTHINNRVVMSFALTGNGDNAFITPTEPQLW